MARVDINGEGACSGTVVSSTVILTWSLRMTLASLGGIVEDLVGFLASLGEWIGGTRQGFLAALKTREGSPGGTA